MLMSAADYRESLRRYRPTVYVDGNHVADVADEPSLAPGINALGVSYDFALRESTQALFRARVSGIDAPVNRMLAIPYSSADLLDKLEAVPWYVRRRLRAALALPRSAKSFTDPSLRSDEIAAD